MIRKDDDTRRCMEWSTDEGVVILSYPADLSSPDIDDVEALFALTIRILRRRRAAAEQAEAKHD